MKEKTNTITLSPKQLGTLADHDFCKRCFWIGAKLKHKYPYAMFPGIFSVFDKYQKELTAFSFAQGKTPPWLAEFGAVKEVIPPMHWSAFSMTLDCGIVFRGVPDTMLRMADGSIVIIDEKTAKPKEEDNPLEKLYDAQLNGYAKIAQAIGLGAVSALGIVYNVPVEIGPDMAASAALQGDQYVVKFKPQVRKVAIDQGWLDDILDTACKLMLAETCPSGKDKCANCALIDAMAHVAWIK